FAKAWHYDRRTSAIACIGNERKYSLLTNKTRKNGTLIKYNRNSTSMKVIEGNAEGTELKVGIVVARFNELITSKLLEGATDTVRRHGVTEENITVLWVPGAFETPLAAKKLAEDGAYHAVITLGAVIRGAPVHFDYVCNETAKGVSQVS